MINAKEELMEHIRNRENWKSMSLSTLCEKVELVRIALRGYSGGYHNIEGSLNHVLPLLDFEYDGGYGGQYLYGYIWYADGTWSERGEYDGSEWWVHKEKPKKDIKISGSW